jgi:hypothetical protein
VNPGGNESKLGGRLNIASRRLTWREAGWTPGSDRIWSSCRLSKSGQIVRSALGFQNLGNKVDNRQGPSRSRCQGNAKDGNLDRDVVAYQALYDAGLIDAAVMITRTQGDPRSLAVRLAQELGGVSPNETIKRLGATTMILDKLLPRITSGDLGGCTFLGVFMCKHVGGWGDQLGKVGVVINATVPVG